jgi:hypothetical protein
VPVWSGCGLEVSAVLKLAQDDRLDEGSRPEGLPPDRLLEPRELVRLELDHDPPPGELGLLEAADHRIVAEAAVLSHGSVFFAAGDCGVSRRAGGRSAPVLGPATVKPENRAIRSTAKDGAAETALDQDRQTSEPDRFASVCTRIRVHCLARLDGLLDALRRLVSGEPRQKLAQSVASVPLLSEPQAKVETVETVEAPALVSIKEAAQLAHVSRAHMWRLVDKRAVPAFRLGEGHGPLRVDRDGLLRWLEEKRL